MTEVNEALRADAALSHQLLGRDSAREATSARSRTHVNATSSPSLPRTMAGTQSIPVPHQPVRRPTNQELMAPAQTRTLERGQTACKSPPQLNVSL